MEAAEDTSLASKFIEKAFNLMDNNRHTLWRLLQEIFGRTWFHPVFLDRSKNNVHGIDYQSIEEILPQLNKLFVKEKPDKIDFLAGEYGDLLKNIIDSYQEQVKVCWEVVHKKEQLMRICISEAQRDKDKLVAMKNKTIGDEATQNNSSVLERQPSKLEKQGSKWDRQLTLNIDDFPLVNTSEDDQNQVNPHLKIVNMLVNEFQNLQSDYHCICSNYAMMENRNNILVRFIKEILGKAGAEVDANNLEKTLLRFRKMDKRDLNAAGIDKAIQSRKIDLVAKCAVQTLASNNRVTKSTNTDSVEYQDIVYNDPEMMSKFVLEVRKLRGLKDSKDLRTTVGGISSHRKVQLSKFQSSRAEFSDKNKLMSNYSLMKKERDDSRKSRPEEESAEKQSRFPGPSESSVNVSPVSKKSGMKQFGNSFFAKPVPMNRTMQVQSKIMEKESRDSLKAGSKEKVNEQETRKRTPSMVLENSDNKQPIKMKYESRNPLANFNASKQVQTEQALNTSETFDKRGRNAAVSKENSEYSIISPGLRQPKAHPRVSLNKSKRSKSQNYANNYFEDSEDQGEEEFKDTIDGKRSSSNKIDLKNENIALGDLESHNRFAASNLSKEGDVSVSNPYDRESSAEPSHNPTPGLGNTQVSGFDNAGSRFVPGSFIRRRRKKPMPARNDIFVLDSIQIAMAMDKKLGLYLKITPNTRTNNLLQGRPMPRMSITEANKGVYFTYLLKPEQKEQINPEEERLKKLLEEKCIEIENIKSKFSITEELTIGSNKEFGFQVKDEDEMEQIRHFLSLKNKKAIEKMELNLMNNLEGAGLDNCDFLQRTMNTSVSSKSQPADKASVRLFDNMELFNREYFPSGVIKKLKRLDKEKDKFAKTGNVFDRLYQDSVLKPLVEAEKQNMVRDMENNRFVKEWVNENHVLYDVNGTSLVYNTRTGQTLIDIKRTIDLSNGQKAGKDSLPIPTFLTHIDQQNVKEIVDQYVEVEDGSIDETVNHNDLLPVDIMQDGSLGVTLRSISLVVKKIFNQMYSVKKSVSKASQTLTSQQLIDQKRKTRNDESRISSSDKTTRQELKKRVDYLLKKNLVPNRLTLQNKVRSMAMSLHSKTFDHGSGSAKEESMVRGIKYHGQSASTDRGEL